MNLDLFIDNPDKWLLYSQLFALWVIVFTGMILWDRSSREKRRMEKWFREFNERKMKGFK